MAETPPNVVLIVSDQHNPRLAGYAGHPTIRTPNLDALAASGTVFDRAYCNTPVCGPSRMSYMAGKHLHQIGTWWNGVPLDPEEMTWARKLHEHGVETALFGKIDAPGDYENPGFSRAALTMRRGAHNAPPRREPPRHMVAGFVRAASRAHLEGAGPFDPEAVTEPEWGYSNRHGLYFQDRQTVDWTLAYLREKGRSGSHAPWLVHVGLEQPHWPYVCPRRHFDPYFPDRVVTPHDAVFPNPRLPAALQEWQRWNGLGEVSDELLARVLAAYYGMVTCMDEMIGEIRGELSRQGLAENTVVVYTSDHGESLGEHGLFFKHCPYEGSAGVPLLASGPGFPAGRRVAAPVSLIDLYPTLSGLYGIEPEADRPGRDLRGVIEAEPAPEEADPVLVEWLGPGFNGAWFMLAGGRYKYTWYEAHPPTLFDLLADPGEDRDLAPDPRYAEVLRRFEGALRARIDPEAVAERAKRDLGVIDDAGRDWSKPGGEAAGTAS